MNIEKLDDGLVVISCQSRFDDAMLTRDIEWFVRNGHAASALQQILGDLVNVTSNHCYPRNVKLRCYFSLDRIVGVSEPATNECIDALFNRMADMPNQIPSSQMIMDLLNIADAAETVRADVEAIQALYAKYNSPEHLDSMRLMVSCYKNNGLIPEGAWRDRHSLQEDGLITTVSNHQGLSYALTPLGGQLAFLGMHCSRLLEWNQRLVYVGKGEGVRE